ITQLLVQRGAPDELIGRTEAVIAREEARAWSRIASYRERLAGKKVLLITGGVKSWSVVAALQEGGMEVVGTSVKKSTQEDKERIKELMGQDAHMIEDMTPRETYKMLKEARADIMLSGGRSQFIALKAKMPWLDINQERHYAYAGYEGMVALVHEIDRALSNPVWSQVRLPAPWEETSWEQAADAVVAAEAELPPEDERDRELCNCTGLSVGAVEDAMHASADRGAAGDAGDRRRRGLRRLRQPRCRAARARQRWRYARVRQGGVRRAVAEIVASRKACTVNPLKMSQPIGGALAFMGVNNCMPLLHGSQGCTSFGLVLFVRHFREAIPLQTTAMSEVATVLGGLENVEQAILTIAKKTKPSMIGICSTGVTEIK